MLAVDHLQSAYGPAQVLFDIGLRVGAGEVVTLLGRNGMGKTTTIHTIMGLLPATGGSAVFDDLSQVGLPPIGSRRRASDWFPRAGRSFRPSPSRRT
jgi:branched-chain amino acid transport system ATP-binding protein